MATDTDKHAASAAEQPANSATTRKQSSSPRESAPTQVGQVIGELGRLTRRLPTTRPRRQRMAARRATPAVSRETIAGLVAALGDPLHPDHARAVDDLVEIGPPAVPALNEALGTHLPWLSAYRAAEALGRIGDGRAAGPLTQALRHPNSNVRWSAVRALTQVGDVRTVFELRRVVEEDEGRTSWGEPVAGAAQSALDQLQQTSVWSQSLELVKTAVTSVLMILALIMAFSVMATLRDELDSFGEATPGQVFALVQTPEPIPTVPAPAVAPPLPTADLAPPTPTTTSVTLARGTVLQTSNVRPSPGVNNTPIGRVEQGDTVVYLAQSVDGQWYRIRLDTLAADGSFIDNPDGSASGWINSALVSAPDGEVPIETDILSPAAATPTP